MIKFLCACSVAAPALVCPAYAEESEVCAGRFRKLLVDSALWLPRQQATYWKDVWQSRGRRLFLVNRESKEQFNKGALLDPFAYPFTLPPEILKTKYKPSVPATIILSMPGVVLTYDWIDGHYMKDAVAESLDVPGADYAIALSAQGMIPVQSVTLEAAGASTASSDLARIVSDHHELIYKWFAPGGSWRELPRFRQLRDLGVLRDDADAAKLDRLARSAVAQAAKGTAKNASEEEFVNRVGMEWAKALKADVDFGKREERDQMLLAILFTPALNVTLSRGSIGGKSYSDLTLFDQVLRGTDPRLRPLRSIAAQLDPVSLLKMAMQVLEVPELVASKKRRWQEVDPGAKTLPSFIERPDYPAVAESGFAKDELEIWERVWKDPNFADIKAALKSGQMTEVMALGVAIERISERP